MKAPLVVGILEPVDERHNGGNDRKREINAPIAQEIADDDQYLGGERQLALARLEHLDHFRHDVNHHARHDA